MQPTKQLVAVWQRNSSLLCVGLDPDPARLPASLTGTGGAIFSFCHATVDATVDLACVFKPQIAYSTSQRIEDQLEQLINYIHGAYPGIPVILDVKRGDVGSTTKHYAKKVFERYQADVITVSPYMGFDSMQPYLAYADKGVIMLCRASSAGGSDVQFLKTDGCPIYQVVAEHARSVQNINGQMDSAMGATFPEEIAKVREITGDMPLLISGMGIQGGDIEATVRVGHTAGDTGTMTNSSWATLCTSTDSDFTDAARRMAEVTRNQINQSRT